LTVEEVMPAARQLAVVRWASTAASVVSRAYVPRWPAQTIRERVEVAMSGSHSILDWWRTNDEPSLPEQKASSAMAYALSAA
jgi:hypothetical protein